MTECPSPLRTEAREPDRTRMAAPPEAADFRREKALRNGISIDSIALETRRISDMNSVLTYGAPQTEAIALDLAKQFVENIADGKIVTPAI